MSLFLYYSSEFSFTFFIIFFSNHFSKKNIGLRRIQIKLIDAGHLVNCLPCEIKELQPNFIKFPAQSIDLYLLGLMPLSFENRWHPSMTKSIRFWLSNLTETHQKYECEAIYVEARIMLDIQEVLLATELKIINTLYKVPKVSEVIVEVISRRFGFYDQSMIKSILKMAKTEGE